MEGQLFFFMAMEAVQPVTFSLFINGFSFNTQEEEISVSLSPFSLVRCFKFQECEGAMDFADMKMFKISLAGHNLCYYYGVRCSSEGDSEQERLRWVCEISRVMHLITVSLFPPFFISCEPLALVASTHDRLMAGYLIYEEDPFVASVMYCELHPHYDGQAKLALYENEFCAVPVMDIYITERTALCTEPTGVNRTCFFIDGHHFCSRTYAERNLWCRAVSNLKVKLHFQAPTPTGDDLQHYRQAIGEHMENIKPSLESAATDALLRRHNPAQHGLKTQAGAGRVGSSHPEELPHPTALGRSVSWDTPPIGGDCHSALPESRAEDDALRENRLDDERPADDDAEASGEMPEAGEMARADAGPAHGLVAPSRSAFPPPSESDRAAANAGPTGPEAGDPSMVPAGDGDLTVCEAGESWVDAAATSKPV